MHQDIEVRAVEVRFTQTCAGCERPFRRGQVGYYYPQAGKNRGRGVQTVDLYCSPCFAGGPRR